jgi:hypothetical protein
MARVLHEASARVSVSMGEHTGQHYTCSCGWSGEPARTSYEAAARFNTHAQAAEAGEDMAPNGEREGC